MTQETAIARHLVLVGRVQGVSFRANMKIIAETHEVAGWVKNLSNGNVEAHVQGRPQNVERVIEWSRRGPQGAKVLDLLISEADVRQDFKKFFILR